MASESEGSFDLYGGPAQNTGKPAAEKKAKPGNNGVDPTKLTGFVERI